MKQTKKFCKKCGAEITDPKAKICANCGAKISKPIFKKWWFWVIIVVGVAIIGSAAGGEGNDTGSETTASQTTAAVQTNKYTSVELQKMLDDLNDNAMKAESTYQNMYVEVTGKIVSFDSDGKYVSIEAVGAGEWNFETVTCYIKSDAQRAVLMEKSKGDKVVIKGKIISIGELLGYSINIDEVS